MRYDTKLATKTKISVKTLVGTVALLGLATASAIVVSENNYSKAQEAMLQKMKFKGCVADGLLTGSGGDTKNSIDLIERSKCEYLHRSIETWAAPPDFGLIEKNLAQLEGKYINGMFLAEAIGTESVYRYPDGKGSFNFQAMCRGGSEGMWGPNTCKANMASQEYRKYLTAITRKAIDLGVESFMFGQVFFQDASQPDTKTISKIVGDIHSYARSKGKVVTVGAQTNDITDEKYLQVFDFIEGGIGVYDDGTFEEGPCLKGLWKVNGGSCWGLLWHKNYSSKAKNVILHLDWSGLAYDDMSRFARMEPELRVKTLRKLYRYFTVQNMGFLMPFLAVVNGNNGSGCYGPHPEFYSPDRKYGCKDEDPINAILGEDATFNNSFFLMEDVPLVMAAGKKYDISITFKNTGNSSWSKKDQFFLAPQALIGSNDWPAKVELGEEEAVAPGQEKKFDFSVVAPTVPGSYDFSWQMVKGDKFFGGPSENVRLTVADGPAE